MKAGAASCRPLPIQRGIMIRDQYVPIAPEKSEKGLKPKVVKRPAGKKDVERLTRDMQAVKGGRGGYKTR
ncbi:hypothetical protein MesoLjLc_50590 [Mesorhizobium sp. L-8-10]|nr:hypothetical protein MesoLjLc_50590 [Mesorhizobium sp. L-8-10]